jgi:hypothetical protein
MRFVVPALLLVACGGPTPVDQIVSGSICTGNHCGCASQWLLCNEQCVDAQHDSDNCGDCGRHCLPTMECVRGVCGCANIMSFCHDRCVDLRIDHDNCGDCGVVCPFGSPCIAGQCACPAGQMLCDSECTDLANDALNCGVCGNACGAYTCLDGKCVQD